MKYNKVPSNLFQTLVLGAGILCKTFDPQTATVESTDIIGATGDGSQFDATPSFIDLGDGIDNCAKNLKEAKILQSWEVALTGTLRTISSAVAKSLMGAGDVTGGSGVKTIKPRNELKTEDFCDLWLVADYGNSSDKFIAIHILNALSTGGLSIKTNNEDKGGMSFTYTGHGSVTDNNTPPFEVYISEGA